MVAEGSFSRAARRLNLSQPAVTARVQKLEHTLGARLLNRTTRNVEVTEAGRCLAVEAEAALRGLGRLVARMLEESGKARRRVAVATTPMVAAQLLPAALRRWREEHPDIEVVVRDLRHAAVLDSLDRGECDLAVIALDRAPPRFRFDLLMDDEMVALVPEGHELGARRSISLAELAAQPVMLLEHYTEIQARLEQACGALGLRFTPSVVVANLQTVLGMLESGTGLALLPRVMAMHGQRRPRRGLSIEGVTLRRRYGIVTPGDREPGAAVRSFCDFLRACWPDS